MSLVCAAASGPPPAQCRETGHYRRPSGDWWPLLRPSVPSTSTGGRGKSAEVARRHGSEPTERFALAFWSRWRRESSWPARTDLDLSQHERACLRSSRAANPPSTAPTNFCTTSVCTHFSSGLRWLTEGRSGMPPVASTRTDGIILDVRRWTTRLRISLSTVL
jgi:hypothetical protein